MESEEEKREFFEKQSEWFATRKDNRLPRDVLIENREAMGVGECEEEDVSMRTKLKSSKRVRVKRKKAYKCPAKFIHKLKD